MAECQLLETLTLSWHVKRAAECRTQKQKNQATTRINAKGGGLIIVEFFTFESAIKPELTALYGDTNAKRTFHVICKSTCWHFHR
jgi:hypothetical protein